jgi:FKBP-type peptidyl-prolyl cis-trans isomerase FkpA
MKAASLILISFSLFTTAGCHRPSTMVSPSTFAFENEGEKALYVMGDYLGDEVASGFFPSPREARIIAQGMYDEMFDAPLRVNLERYQSRIRDLRDRRVETLRNKLSTMNTPYLAQAAAQPGAIKTPSGAIFRTLQLGTGQGVSADSVVTLKFLGYFADGTVFSNEARLGPAHHVPAGRQLPCWRESIPRMHVGERANVVCPPAAAYGSSGRSPNIPPDAVVAYDIEIDAIESDEGGDFPNGLGAFAPSAGAARTPTTKERSRP